MNTGKDKNVSPQSETTQRKERVLTHIHGLRTELRSQLEFKLIVLNRENASVLGR